MTTLPDTAELVDAAERTQRQATLDSWILVGCYAMLYVAVSLVVEHFVLTSEIIEQPWLEAGLDESLEAFAERRNTWRLYGYVLTPLFVLIKIGFTAVCLSIGCALAYWEIHFSDIFRVSAQAEIVWAVVAVAHAAYVLFVLDVETIFDYTGFYPLSVLNLFTIDEGNLWAVYLLKTLNVFEIAYVTMLVAGLRTLVAKPVSRLTSLVLLSYGGGMLLLVSAVTFTAMALI